MFKSWFFFALFLCSIANSYAQFNGKTNLFGIATQTNPTQGLAPVIPGKSTAETSICGTRVAFVMALMIDQADATNTEIIDRALFDFITPTLQVAGTNSRFSQTLSRIEDNVLDFYERFGPSSRRPEDLASSLNISIDAAEKIMLFYNLDDSLSVFQAEGRRIYQDARYWAYFTLYADRILYYKNNVGRFSVAEIARDLSLTEELVYQELFNFDISISQWWNNPLVVPWYTETRDGTPLVGLRDELSDLEIEFSSPPSYFEIVQRLRAVEFTTSDISIFLKLSVDAITSIEHYEGTQPRGTAWALFEEQSLTQHYGIVPLPQLAQYLSRTEASLRAKATELGLTEPTTPTIPDRIFIAPYGLIRTDGVFDREILQAYILNNIHRSNHDLAEELGSSVSTVNYWLLKLNIFKPNSSSTRTRAHNSFPISQATKDRHQRQADVVSLFFSAIAKGRDVYKREDFPGSSSAYYEATGTSKYSHGHPFYHQRTFDSPLDMWIAISRSIESKLRELETSGETTTHEYINLAAFSPWNIHFKGSNGVFPPEHTELYDTYRPQQQKNVVDLLTSFIARGEDVYSNNNFPGGSAAFYKATGSSVYALGKSQYHLRAFDNSLDMWSAVCHFIQSKLRELETLGETTTHEYINLAAFSPWNIYFKGSNGIFPPKHTELYDTYRPLQQRHVIDQLSSFIARGEDVFNINDFPGGSIEYNKATGSANYALGKSQYHLRAFDNSLDMWSAVSNFIQSRLRELEADGQTHSEEYINLAAFSPWSIEFSKSNGVFPPKHTELYDAYRPQQQRHIIDQLSSFIARGEDVFRVNNFPGGISEYNKATGSSSYAHGKKQGHLRAFDDSLDMWSAVCHFIQSRLQELEISGETNTHEYINLAAFSPWNIMFQKRNGVFPPEHTELYDTYRPQQQKNVVDLLTSFIARGEDVYSNNNFPGGEIEYRKANGSSNYAHGKKQGHLRAFDSTHDMWVAVRAAAETRVAELEASGENPDELGHLQIFLAKDLGIRK
jgi:hypothetical protein